MNDIVKDSVKTANTLITFSASDSAAKDQDYNAMVSAVTNLIRFACKRYGGDDYLPVKYYENGKTADYQLPSLWYRHIPKF